MAQGSDESTINSDFYDWAGLDHLVSPLLVRENKLVQSVNLTSSGIIGGKKTRPPYDAFLNNPDSNKVRNLIPFLRQNNDGTTTLYVIRISGNNAYKYTVGGGATTWGAAIPSFVCTNSTQPFAWTVLNNVLHLSNGTDAYQTFDGLTFTQDISAPKARALTTFQRRVFASNAPGNTSRVYFSSVDYVGAPAENSPLAANYGAGVNTITINNSLAGTNPFGASNTIGSVHWPAILGAGTVNQENVIVIGVSGTAQPYTLTLAANTVNPHSQGDSVVNNAPWFSDNNNSSTANFFDVDPERNGAVIFLDTVNASLLMHKASGALYLYTGQQITNPLQSANPFYSSPGNSTVSAFAPDQISGIEIFPTRDGVYAYSGGFPTIISNEVWDYIQNADQTNIQFAPGIAFKSKWYYAIGTVTDQYGFTIKNCLLVYDYQLNIWDTYSFFDMPTCFGEFVDANGNLRLLFGDVIGNTFIFEQGHGDNGNPMDVVLQTHFLTWGAPDKTKGIDSYLLSTNPGANFQFQFAKDWSSVFQPLTTTAGLGVSDRAPDSMQNWKSLAFRLVSNTLSPVLFYGVTLKVSVGSKRFSGRKI